MIKQSLVLFALSLVFVVFVSPVYAHDDHESGHRDHDHAALCDRFLLKTEADFPDLAKPNWKEIKTIVSGFAYTFYHDSTRPNLAIAAMTVVGTNPDSNLVFTRLTWQVDNEIRSVRLELDEMVCSKSVIGKDGKTYDLEGLLKRLAEKK